MTTDEKLDFLVENVIALNKRFDSLEQRFDSLEQRFDSLEQRFDSLEREQRDFRAYVENTIERKLDVMVEAQVTYEQQLPDMRKLQRDVEFLKLDVDALKKILKLKAS